jgi:putative RecB family exonuclease
VGAYGESVGEPAEAQPRGSEPGGATTTAGSTSGGEAGGGEERPRRRPALSPSRAGDFRVCPLLYRFRAIDRLPEVPGRAQIRGVLVHAVIERLFALPAGQRSPAAAKALVPVVWAELTETDPELAATLFPPPAADDPAADPAADAPGGDIPALPPADPMITELAPAEAPDDPDGGPAGWLASVDELLDSWFRMEDPRTFDPEACELLVETELPSGTLLRGYIDRLDSREGVLRVVDYKTGLVPGEYGETAAMFQLKFYALALLQERGVVPTELRLLYLRGGGQWLSYSPDEAELRRFERILDALWEAIVRAGRDGDFPPRRGSMCRYCSHRALCPAWDGVPPPYPGWPSVDDEPNPAAVPAPR